MAKRRINIYELDGFFHSSTLLMFVLVNWQERLLRSVSFINIPSVVWQFFYIIANMETLLPGRPDIFCLAFYVYSSFPFV